MKIAVGSKNPVKVNAVKSAFESFFSSEKNFVFSELSVESGVAEQPMSDDECILGARNRAFAVQKATNADFSVGIEGGIQETNGVYFCCTWIVIVNQKGKMGMGTSIRLAIPDAIMHLVSKGKSVGEAAGIVFNTTDVGKKNGVYGLMTKNLITRESSYRDAMIAAISHIQSV
ncbi:MAG: inosine/xanthosine triphosphatase [Waddliaceae bacterium]|nr:inosine/xanthosine triphosphatase [Waddliaceae bacterium]